jgi:hypothetical protein
MGAYTAKSTDRHIDFGIAEVVKVCKRILNIMAERAAAAAERSRFAALSARQLEDIGITAAERAAILGYEEPAPDGWRVVASHL